MKHRLDQQRHSRILQNVFVRVKKYSSRTILTLLVGIGLLATLAPAPIAFAAPTDHSNEQSCVDAGYRWQGGTCVDPDAEEEEEAGSSCAIEGMGWIICPAMNFLADSTDAAFGFLSDYFLQTDVSYINGNGTDRPVYNAWAAMRTVANVAFVIAFMIIIYSQMTSMGISNYGVKKMLPRLVIAAILVNLSFFICQLAIDISNILGSTLNDFFRSLGTYIETGESFDPSVSDQVAQGIGAGLLITGALAAGVGILLAASMPVILAALLALLLILLILFARIALIILLVIISPLAFVAFLLPNTEQWFKKWYKMFAALLMVYPIISVVFGASSLAASVIYTSATSGDDTNWMLQIVALGVATIPLFLVPSLLKNSMSAAGSIGGKLAGMSSKATGRVGAKVRDTSRLGEAQRGLKNKFALSRASRRGKVTTAIGKTRAGKALGLENGIDNSRFGRALGLDKGAAAAISMVNKAEDEAVDQAIIRMRAGSDPREMINDAAQHLETANKNGDVVSARAAQKILLNSGSKGVAKLHDTLHGIEASGNLNEGVSRELRADINGAGLKGKDNALASWAYSQGKLGDIRDSAGTYSSLNPTELAGQSVENLQRAQAAGGISPEQARATLDNPSAASLLDQKKTAILEGIAGSSTSSTSGGWNSTNNNTPGGSSAGSSTTPPGGSTTRSTNNTPTNNTSQPASQANGTQNTPTAPSHQSYDPNASRDPNTVTLRGGEEISDSGLIIPRDRNE